MSITMLKVHLILFNELSSHKTEILKLLGKKYILLVIFCLQAENKADTQTLLILDYL